MRGGMTINDLRRRMPGSLVMSDRLGWVIMAIGVLLAAALLVAPWLRDSPTAVVSSYLDAVRNGDVEAAVEYANGGADGAADGLLTKSAVSDGWRVVELTETAVNDSEAYVDVTIEGSDGATAGGRFELFSFNESWRMTNPFALINNAGAMPFLTVNGATIQSGGSLLFPGEYRLYDNVSELVSVEPPTLLVIGDSSVHLRSQPYVEYTVTEAGEQAAAEALEKVLVECAEYEEAAPPACPFNAGSDDTTMAQVLGDEYEVDDVSWQLGSVPRLRLAPGTLTFSAVIDRPGTMQLTATAIPEYSDDDKPRTITADCDIDVTGLLFTMDSDGEFAISGEQYPQSSCIPA
jgi:hypothetical protein